MTGKAGTRLGKQGGLLWKIMEESKAELGNANVCILFSSFRANPKDKPCEKLLNFTADYEPKRL